MATIAHRHNALEQSYKKAKKLSYVGFVSGILCGFLFPVSAATFSAWLCLLSIVGTTVGLLFGSTMQQKADIYESGIAGEQATAQIIAGLPAQYFGVQNLKVTYDGQTSELDMVVIGPTGIFVVETKNAHGTITGDYDGHRWVHTKVSRQGNTYSKELHSPVKQVGTHVYRLAGFLRSNGIYTRVESAVYFADPETVVALSGQQKQIPVFSTREDGGTALQAYITNRTVRVTEAQISQILRLLCK